MSEALLWNEIGNIHKRYGSHQDAIAAYSKAIELDPASSWSCFNLGHAYYLCGEYGHALIFFRKCLQSMGLIKDQVMVWNMIGDTYRALKDFDNAVLAYRKADALELRTPLAGAQAVAESASDSGMPVPPMMKASPAQAVSSDKPSTVSPFIDNPVETQPGEETLPAAAPEPSSPASGQPAAGTVPGPRLLSPIPERKIYRFVKDSGNLQPATQGSAAQAPGLQDLDVLEPVTNLPTPASTSAETTPRAPRPQAPRTTETGTLHPSAEVQTTQPAQAPARCVANENLEEILAKVNVYEKITRVNPNNDRAWDTLGKLYKSLGRYKDAILAYQQAIEKAPEREVYYYYLGLLFTVEQRHDDAVWAFQLVLRKNPNYTLAHSALAGVYHRMGLENKANHHIATALPKMTNESAYNRACFYSICGDNELAIEFLRLALKNKDTTIEWIKSDPDLEAIHTDPRYLALIDEQDSHSQEPNDDNYFSSDLEGAHNQLLPILNHSLAR
jgi:tetratricopeptide (TPR) repeat protein